VHAECAGNRELDGQRRAGAERDYGQFRCDTRHAQRKQRYHFGWCCDCHDLRNHCRSCDLERVRDLGHGRSECDRNRELRVHDASTIDLQASPATVSITGQSTFTAVLRDAAGNFVQGQQVDFTLTDVTGGALSVASAVTDIEGVAQTVYTAGKSASATNGVSVLAKVDSNTTINRTATLTVNGAALHIVLGTGKVIRENATKTAFIQDWFISVADATSNPLPNNQVTLSLHSTSRPKEWLLQGLVPGLRSLFCSVRRNDDRLQRGRHLGTATYAVFERGHQSVGCL